MTTPPAIHLETWRELLGLHPWHFWQFANDRVPMNGACGVTTEYGWQAGDAAGRSDVRAAIANAAARLGELLSVPLTPDSVQSTVTARARLRLPITPVLALGLPVYTLLGTATVSYSDRDGDGLNDTWTATIATTETNPIHVLCAVPASERAGDGLLDWERDAIFATVTIVSGIATITGRAWTMGNPLKYSAANGQPLDPNDATNLLSSISVYRRTFSSATAFSSVAGCGCVACGAITGTLSSGSLGLVCLDTCGCQGGALSVAYTAGLDWTLSSGWAAALTRLAAAELGAPICACEDINRELYRWQKDMALTGKSDEVFGAISAGDLQNPLGTRRGAIAAYRYFLTAQPLGGIRAG